MRRIKLTDNEADHINHALRDRIAVALRRNEGTLASNLQLLADRFLPAPVRGKSARAKPAKKIKTNADANDRPDLPGLPSA